MKGKFLTLLIGMMVLASPMSAKAAEMETSFPNFETTANHESESLETAEIVFENILDAAEKESSWNAIEAQECANETVDTATDEMEETKDVAAEVEVQIQEEIVDEETTTSTVCIPKSYAIPYMSQADYADVPYGKYGTIKSSGCGIVCLAMVASHFKEELVDPAELAKQFGRYNTAQGSSWSLFEDASKELGLKFQEQTGLAWGGVSPPLAMGRKEVHMKSLLAFLL